MTLGLSVALLAVLLVSSSTDAQPASRPSRIGGLWPGPEGASAPYLEAFRKGLSDLGWVDGQNVVMENRYAQDSAERLARDADELVRAQVALIVTSRGQATRAARQATTRIPIVFVAPSDPVGTGIVQSLAHPGGNATGLTLISPELGGKRLQLLKEIAPNVSRVAVLWNPTDPGKALELRETAAAARALGIALQSIEVRRPADFDGAFVAIASARTDALVTLAEPLTIAQRVRIIEFVTRSRLPSMFELREFADDGGLIAYGPNLLDLFRRAAIYADKILKGAKAADLPVEQPTKFELIINLKTARALGLTIPPALRLRADQVIE
jgi:putative tryptophan/tyrosine transport system substrate-binding protein